MRVAANVIRIIFLRFTDLFKPTSAQFICCNLNPNQAKSKLINTPSNNKLPDLNNKNEGTSTIIICRKMPFRLFQK